MFSSGYVSQKEFKELRLDIEGIKDDISGLRKELKEDHKNYCRQVYSKFALHTKMALEQVATKQDLKLALEGLATKEDLYKFATKEDLNKFATKEDLQKFVTKEDAKSFATKNDLKDEFLAFEISLLSKLNKNEK